MEKVKDASQWKNQVVKQPIECSKNTNWQKETREQNDERENA
jgi:hypothetical protein